MNVCSENNDYGQQVNLLEISNLQSRISSDNERDRLMVDGKFDLVTIQKFLQPATVYIDLHERKLFDFLMFCLDDNFSCTLWEIVSWLFFRIPVQY